MVAFVIGLMHFEEVKVAVDDLRQPDVLHHAVDGTDAPGRQGHGSLGNLIDNVGVGQDRLTGTTAVRLGQASLNSAACVD